MSRGRVSLVARAVEQPETLPSHMAMVTGLPPSRHGVNWNDARPARYGRPTVFTRASDAGLRTGLFYGKPKLALLAPEADERFGPPPSGDATAYDSAGVAAAFARAFAADAPHLSLVHLRQPDGAGHKHGWMSEQYLAALREADSAVGTLLEAVARSPQAPRTAILLTTDHGGEGLTHGARRGESSWVIPFICVAPGLQAGRLEPAPTLASVAPTVLAWLGLPALPDAAPPAQGCLPG